MSTSTNFYSRINSFYDVELNKTLSELCKKVHISLNDNLIKEASEYLQTYREREDRIPSFSDLMSFSLGKFLHHMEYQGTQIVSSKENNIPFLNMLCLTSTYEKIFYTISMYPFSMTFLDAHNCGPLFAAIETCDINKVRLIYCANPDINLIDVNGRTPLMYASFKGSIQIIQFLVDVGANLYDKDYRGWNCLLWSIPSPLFPATFNYLISQLRISLYFRDPENNSVFHWISFFQTLLLVEDILIVNFGLFNSLNIFDKHPLYYAHLKNDVSSIEKFNNISVFNFTNLHFNQNTNYLKFTCHDKMSNIVQKLSQHSKNGHDLQITLNFPILFADISKNLELCPVPFIQIDSNNNLKSFFKSFRYVYKQLQTISHINTDFDSVEGCSCIGNCLDNIHCVCATKSTNSQLWYNKNSRLNINDILLFDNNIIHECNIKCSCSSNCSNKLVQKKSNVPLILKHINDKFVVQSSMAITKGEYVAEFFPHSEPIKMDSPNNYGNIASFFNSNGVNTNLLKVSVFYDHLDQRFPHISFFASKNIATHEILSFQDN